MLESGYQKKIMDKWEEAGGHVVNGIYSKSGEADLQGGFPISIGNEVAEIGAPVTPIMLLVHLVVEVKTEEDYHRVMGCLVEEDGLYRILPGVKGLKDHEPMQIKKINEVRKRGGLGLIAWDFSQVQTYVILHYRY